jgi:hypothetical protein
MREVTTLSVPVAGVCVSQLWTPLVYNNISETGFRLRLQVERTQLDTTGIVVGRCGEQMAKESCLWQMAKP